MSPSQNEDWARVVDDVIRGDRTAFLKLSGLVTGFLTRWRAFDFRDDWDDFVQEVILATVEATRRDRIRDPNAVYGYVRSAARFKFIDRIRSKKREAPDIDPEDANQNSVWAPIALRSEELREVWDAVDRLPEKQRVAVVRVYAEGMTYEEAAVDSGIPLGSLKRYLRQGLSALHTSLRATTDAQ